MPDLKVVFSSQYTDLTAAIESRVARIKARVAELTGNMEGGQGPAQGPAPGTRPAVPR